MSALRVEGLSFAYGAGAPALSEVSVAFEAGRSTAILGPNGSGKSTLLSLLLGYREPAEGVIELFGKPLSSYGRRELGRLTAFLSPETYLPFNYSVQEYVLLGRSPGNPSWQLPRREDRIAAERALEGAGVAELAGRNIQELSSGELQLVSLARALAQEPKLLLMDEPTSHLDPANAVSLLRMIRALTGEGLTVLFTTHDPQHALQAAGEAVLLKEGRVVATGGAAQTLTVGNLSRLYGVSFREALIGEERLPFPEL